MATISKRAIISIDEIEKHPVDVAEQMWKDLLQLQKTATWESKSASDKIAEFNVLGYANFITKHTFVARPLIVNGEYSTKAFLMYLIELKRTGYGSQEQYAERQADYMKWLWQAYNPMQSDDDAMKVWNDTRTTVLDELNNFKNDYEISKQKVDTHKAHVNRSLKNDLLHMLARGGTDRNRIAQLYVQGMDNTTSG